MIRTNLTRMIRGTKVMTVTNLMTMTSLMMNKFTPVTLLMIVSLLGQTISISITWLTKSMKICRSQWKIESVGTICLTCKHQAFLSMKDGQPGFVCKIRTHLKMVIHCGERTEFLLKIFDKEVLETVGSLQQQALWQNEAIDSKDCSSMKTMSSLVASARKASMVFSSMHF